MDKGRDQQDVQTRQLHSRSLSYERIQCPLVYPSLVASSMVLDLSSSPFSTVVMHRKVMNTNGFKFHDGLTIPQGTHIAAASCIVNLSADTFENAGTFDGMRFARAQEEADDVSMKQQLTSPALNNLFYGVGKHACPGRYASQFSMTLY